MKIVSEAKCFKVSHFVTSLLTLCSFNNCFQEYETKREREREMWRTKEGELEKINNRLWEIN
jgi:hypothetical protein